MRQNKLNKINGMETTDAGSTPAASTILSSNFSTYTPKTRTRFVPDSHCLSIITICILIVACILLMGCGPKRYVYRAECADDAYIAAKLYENRTGKPAYILKSKDGTHAQAFYFDKYGNRVYLHVYPFFQWGLMEYDKDYMRDGDGPVYESADHFLKGHNQWVKDYLQ